MKRRVVLLGLLINVAVCFAQQDSLRILPGQVTFFYPMGTSGVSSIDYRYSFSFNILSGVTGATEGVEIGGISNINKFHNQGAQIAGISNINGTTNYGAQIAGICNLTGSSSDGVQIAGIYNLANGDVNGMQVAGIANTSGNVDGFQVGGITNTSGSVDGFQVAGIANVSDSIDGSQVAGISNVATNVEGVQIGGISNVSGAKADVQIAGIGNIAKSIDGAQIGGIYNVAGSVKGVQIAGIVNICDSIDGVPIALISIVRKNGYRRWQVSGSEAFYVNLSYVIGIRQLYTMLSIGFKPGSNHNNTGLGMGIGSQMSLSPKSSLDFSAHMYHISRHLVINEDNFLYSLCLNYTHYLGERMEVYAGPSFNMLHAEQGSDAIDIAPNYGIDYNHNYQWKYWVGFNTGFRF